VYGYSEPCYDEYYFRKMGESGGRGGNGGRAGCGGVSGFGGQTLIFAYKNRMNQKKESSSSANRAQPGKNGKEGNGGKNGNTVIVIHHNRNIKVDRIAYVQPDYLSAESGVEPTECSPLPYKPSVPSKPIALYQLETEYLNFMNEQHSAQIHSNLMNRSFLNHIMNQASEVPSLHQLIKRVEALTSNEPLKIGGGNELLRSMLVAINSYSAKNEDEQLVANITSAAVLSAIHRNKVAQQTNIVVDLQSFLEQSVKVSDNWVSLASQVQKSEYTDDYTKSYKSRIKHASEVLDELQRDIEENHVDMSENIEKVLDEIEKLITEKKTNSEDLNRKKSELQDSLIKQQIFEFLKVVFTTLSLTATAAVVPSAAPFVVLAVGAGTTVLDSLAEDIPAVPFKPKDRVWADALALSLDGISQCNKYSESGLIKSERPKRSLKETMTKVETGQKTVKAFGDLVTPVARSVSQAYKNGKQKPKTMRLMEEAIKRNLADMHNLERARNEISCLNRELVDAVFKNISDHTKDQAGKSSVYLRMSKYKLKRIIDDFRAVMFQLVQHFESKGLVDTTIKSLENAIITINDVNGLSEAYNDQIKFATYIADITKPTATSIHADYERQVASLKKTILINVISQKYEQALKALGFWSFPFYCHNTELAMASHNSVQTDVAGKLKTLLDLVKSDKV